jgi:hypothetical protein
VRKFSDFDCTIFVDTGQEKTYKYVKNKSIEVGEHIDGTAKSGFTYTGWFFEAYDVA